MKLEKIVNTLGEYFFATKTAKFYKDLKVFEENFKLSENQSIDYYPSKLPIHIAGKWLANLIGTFSITAACQDQDPYVLGGLLISESIRAVHQSYANYEMNQIKINARVTMESIMLREILYGRWVPPMKQETEIFNQVRIGRTED